MLLLAGATSLPEAATVASATLDGAPNLAVGGLFGSSMANMAILAIIDLLHRGRVWPRIGLGHARLNAVAISLTSIAVLAILVPTGVAIGWVGLDTLAIVAVYIAASRWMSRSRGEGAPAGDGSVGILAPTGWSDHEERRQGLRHAVARFVIAAIVILAAAPALALSAKGIADATGIGQTFVGAVLLAGVTSLPELVGIACRDPDRRLQPGRRQPKVRQQRLQHDGSLLVAEPRLHQTARYLAPWRRPRSWRGSGRSC